MIYKSTSIKEVIGRVIRNTRLQDSAFIQDMGEWIPEAMGYMRTKVVLSPAWKDVTIDFHKGKLPCGLRTLTAVSYKGCRLRYNAGVQAYGARSQSVTEPAYVSQPASVVSLETVGTKIFSANATGNIYALDYLVASDSSHIEVTSLINRATLSQDISDMQSDLNSLGVGTFLCSWANDVLNISVTDSTITGIAYHRVTLDSEVLLMNLSVNDTVESVYQSTLLNNVTAIMNQPYCNHTYYTELDYINTSICDGVVRLFYKTIPLDEFGFPLIPDNEDYKEALYWYVRTKLIGAGYRDTVFKFTDCEERFNVHATRAIGQIKYPSVDQVETSLEISTRLILPDNYFETFFANPGKEGLIDL